MSRPTIFFCVGAQKSGTTLLARLLDQHPKIACIWESYAFRPAAQSSIFNPESGSWKRHGFAAERVARWSGQWRRPLVRLTRPLLRRVGGRDLVGQRLFRRTMQEALEDFARRTGAEVVGDKWPWYIDYLEETLAAFPDARFIYNVRDPRGIWNSGQRFRGRALGDRVLDEMLDKDRRVRPYLEQENFLTLRYEDLVRRPEETVRTLYQFLGCRFDADYLSYDPERDPYPDRWQWIPEARGPLNPWHAQKWREQVPPETQSRLVERSRPFIEHYGYPR